MPLDAPRVAFFADSFHEVNGVALTSRRIDAHARKHGLPFFSCHAGPETTLMAEGPVTTCELALSPISLGLESDLRFDMLFARHRQFLLAALKDFDPHVVHVTGPSHIGILGAMMAHTFKVPMLASWHTNIHEYGGRRLENMLSFLPAEWTKEAGNLAEKSSLEVTLLFYKLGKILMAPNAELCQMLEERTGRECFLMPRGVDTAVFTPDRRDRPGNAFVAGYVGRLSPEKNVRLLARVEQALAAAGIGEFRICIVGGGNEREWLEQNVRHGEFPGVLRDEKLARAYANMDVFVFPSRTDTYGNVVQEAMASGVPCVVTNEGGPKFLVKDGVEGFVAATDEELCDAVVRLAGDPGLLASMRAAARERALSASWQRVCEGVWQAYSRAAG